MHAVRHREEMHSLLMWVQDAKDGENDGGVWHLQVLWVFAINLNKISNPIRKNDITELKS